MLQKLLRGLLVLVLIGIGVLVYLGWLSPAARRGYKNVAASQHLIKGMTAAAVLKQMGPPDQEFNMGKDGKLWIYQGPPIYLTDKVAIRLDPGDRVIYVLPPQ